jgi:hypothetical protein
VRHGELIAGAAGAALLGSLFLPWYGVQIQVADVTVGESFSAWEVLSVVDLLLASIALTAILVALAGALRPQPGAPLLLTAAGGVALVLVLFRLVDLPIDAVSPVASGDSIELGRDVGIFAALFAAAAIAYGGWTAQAARARPGRAHAAR